MKKSLLALAILGSAVGAANAASSVTMYGRVDVGYEKVTGTNTTQSGGGETRFGIKGNEDLGNGLAATFQLEGRFDADTGSKTATNGGNYVNSFGEYTRLSKDLGFFDREATVGLKGSFGHVRFGRSVSAMDRALGGYAPGERVATTFDPYASATRHSNSMFYDFEANGFNMGFNIATKGGAFGNTNEGKSKEETAYGVHAGYAIGGFRVNAAYQADNQGTGLTSALDSNKNIILSTTEFGADKEWGVGMAYKFNMFEVGATYAEAKATDAELTSVGQKMKTMGGYVTADVTSNDSLYVRYLEKRASIDNESFLDTKVKVISGGYKHDLSKRTSVYFDIARYSASDVKSSNQYDIAMRHSF